MSQKLYKKGKEQKMTSDKSENVSKTQKEKEIPGKLYEKWLRDVEY